MKYMFCECKYLVSLNLKKFNTLNVEEIKGIFDGCINFNEESIITYDNRILKHFKAFH